MAVATGATRGERMSRSWQVFRALTAAELKTERDFTVVGILKWIAEPLSYMLIYFALIAVAFNRGRPNYLLFLLCALLPWRLFSGVTTDSMNLMRRHARLIANLVVPREVLPLVGVAAQALTFLIALPLFAPFMAMYGIVPTTALVWLPVLIVGLFVLAAGPAYLGALFGLYFPDFRGVAQNLIRAAFFLATGLLPLKAVPGDTFRLIYQLNPLSSVFEGFRSVILFGVPPRPFFVAYPLAFGFALLSIGLMSYRRRQSEFAKEV